MRKTLLLLHRWAGLIIAGFLFVAGVTGAVISWDDELDDLLNPQLVRSSTPGVRLDALALAASAEVHDPRFRVTGVVLDPEPGHSLALNGTARVDPASGQQYDIAYDEVFLDPVTGAELGRREWGQAWPISRTTFVSFLYKLHYSLALPEMWGIDRWGYWLMGVIAVVWTLDCFTGFYLTLPVRRNSRPETAPHGSLEAARNFWMRWRPAWQIKAGGSTYRINFDIHRAFGLWTWALLFILAFTAFSMNLYREVFFPLMSTVSEVTPTPFDLRVPADRNHPIEPRLSFADILFRARAEAGARGLSEPIGALFYSPDYGIYRALLFSPGGDHGAAGVGPAQLFFDGKDGRLLGDRQPWKGTAADIFMQAQFPLHSGRILGLPGRILISVMGLVVAALSVTGVVIWWKKRRARSHVTNARPIGSRAV